MVLYKTPIVITGASGFVGQALLYYLNRIEVPAIGVARQQCKDLTASKNAVLVHLAQRPDASGSFDDSDIELCDTLSRMSWRHVVYASSAVVYGDTKSYPRSPEEPLAASSDYTHMKLACEAIISRAGGTSLRMTNLYGPGMHDTTVISKILCQIPGTGCLRLEDLSPIRDFLWIEDAVRCLVAALQIMPGGVFNVGSGCGVAVGDVAQLALELAGERSRDVVGDEDASLPISCLILDIQKTKTMLHWSPEIDIRAGLSLLLNQKK